MSKINRSIYAIKLWFGIEKPYALSIMISEIIILAIGDFWVKAFGSVILISAWVLLAKLNSYDGYYFAILVRHLRRPNKYAAYSKLGSQHYKKIKYRTK